MGDKIFRFISGIVAILIVLLVAFPFADPQRDPVSLCRPDPGSAVIFQLCRGYEKWKLAAVF